MSFLYFLLDGVRAVGFHCPSLASGTYSTSGKLGGSQLGLVPIDVGIGQVVNWEASIPIEVPCKISGTKLNELHFFLKAITTTAQTDRSTSPKNYYGHVSGSDADLFRISSSVVVLVSEYRS